MRRAESPQALVRRRHPDGARRVGREADVGLPGGHRGCRSARRATGQGAGERTVGRCPVVRVVAGDAVRELVGAGDAPQRRTAAEQVADRRCRRGLGPGVVEERGVAGADAVALDGEQVLDRDGQPRERPVPCTLPERIADGPPHRAVERLRAGCDVGGRDQPPAVDPLPHLRLQPGAAAGEARDRDEQRGIRRERPVLDALDHPRRHAPAHAAEGMYRVVPDEQAGGIAPHRPGAGRERGVEHVEVIGHDGAFVGVEGLAEVGRHRLGSGCLSHRLLLDPRAGSPPRGCARAPRRRCRRPARCRSRSRR